MFFFHALLSFFCHAVNYPTMFSILLSRRAERLAAEMKAKVKAQVRVCSLQHSLPLNNLFPSWSRNIWHLEHSAYIALSLPWPTCLLLPYGLLLLYYPPSIIWPSPWVHYLLHKLLTPFPALCCHLSYRVGCARAASTSASERGGWAGEYFGVVDNMLCQVYCFV